MPPSTFSPSSPARSGSQRGGFTMIELLTVLAIIVIIAGILVVGLGSAAHSQQRDATVTTLKRLDNAMTELTATPGASQKIFTIQLPNIYFPPKDASFDFPNSKFKTWVAVPAGAIESQVRTALVLKQVIGANPSARKFLEDLPPERKKEVIWEVDEGTVPGSKLLPKAKMSDGTMGPSWVMPLDAWGNPVVFVFDSLQIGTGTNTGRPFTVALSGATETEVGGLTNLYSDADKSYYEPAVTLDPAPIDPSTTMSSMPNQQMKYDRTMDMIVPARKTYTPRVKPNPDPADPNKGREFTLRSPDHRPFWMSAGPDGKYETTDDNVYSFGN